MQHSWNPMRREVRTKATFRCAMGRSIPRISHRRTAIAVEPNVPSIAALGALPAASPRGKRRGEIRPRHMFPPFLSRTLPGTLAHAAEKTWRPA